MQPAETLGINIGYFKVHLETHSDEVLRWVKTLYSEFPRTDLQQDFHDFHIRISPPTQLRRFIRPQIQFYFNEHAPFVPLPRSQAVPMFEWGLNWCIANHAHQYLLFHAAGLAKNDTFVLLPAPPGSGKSTLTAALMLHGWQLYSDELVMIDLKNNQVHGLSRPINLKNNSIDLITNTFSNSVMSSKFHDTAKGTVALLKPTGYSVQNVLTKRPVTHILFPKFERDSHLQSKTLSKTDAFMDLIANSFNYLVLGNAGFQCATQLVDSAECLTMKYSNFSDAFRFFDRLAG
ncbi:MAG: HprK-related kinase A [Pseudomonadales bacterium]|nr:HprK-related kinase A [Pseudomonadales bacterium]